MIRIFILLFALVLPVMAENSPDYTNVQNVIKTIEEKQKEKKWEISNNNTQAEMISGNVPVPVGDEKYNCERDASNQIHCYNTQTSYNPSQPIPAISIDGKQANSVVPEPKQYKNVFKIITLVMYMFAVVYFLIQIALEGYRKRYMQALIHLLLFLVGSSLLYYAFRAVFNA